MLFRENEGAQKLKNNPIDLQGAIQEAGYDAQNLFPVMVQFKSHTPNEYCLKEYCYFFNIEEGRKQVRADDIVVVQAKEKGNYELAKISSIPDDVIHSKSKTEAFIDALNSKIGVRTIVTNIQLNVDLYELAEREAKEKEKLIEDLNKEFEKANKMALYEQLAVENPRFKEKLDRVKELGGL